VTQDSVKVVKLEVFDKDESDRVTVRATVAKDMQAWIFFDADSATLTLKPSTAVPKGLKRITVTLDDSKTKIEYRLSFWVIPLEQAGDTIPKRDIDCPESPNALSCPSQQGQPGN